MARLSDVPRVFKHVGPFSFFRRVGHQVGDDNLLTWAAAMAYSWLFALFPFLIFLLSLVPLLPPQARNKIVDRVDAFIEAQLPGTAGDTVRQTILPLLGEDVQTETPEDYVQLYNHESRRGEIISVEPEDWREPTDKKPLPDKLTIRSSFSGEEETFLGDQLARVEPADDTVAGIIAAPVDSIRSLLSVGLLLTLFTASGGMNMTMSALDRCYDIQKPRPFWKQRLIAIALTLVTGTLVLVVLLLIPLSTIILKVVSGGIISDVLGGELPLWVSLSIDAIRYTFGVLLLIMVLGLIYHFGPSLKRRFHLVTPGAIFTIAAWLLTGYALRTYVESFGAAENYAKTYGAVGGIVILLLLFYVDALVLMIGAEINSEIDFAVLGIPQKDDEHPEEVADVRKHESEMDDEDRELAKELREVQQPQPPQEQPPKEQPSKPETKDATES